MSAEKKIIIVGGGAAGFFAAITAAEKNKNAEVIILERGIDVLGKVKVSGGGRCNVTHACFDPRELVKFYPRGEKALLGPFNRFCTGDTVEWFEKRGVKLKTEEDGRMFPVTDNSQTIVDCLIAAALKAGVKIKTKTSVEDIFKEKDLWKIKLADGNFFEANKILIATGSSNRIWDMMKKLGHTIAKPVPSLFTFNIKDERIKNLPGVSVEDVSVKIKETKSETRGALLITHWGMSGPAVLKLSSYAARELSEMKYHFTVQINFLPAIGSQNALSFILKIKSDHHRKKISVNIIPEIPKRLWVNLIAAAQIDPEKNWADLNKKEMENLSQQIFAAEFTVHGKNTFKEEFVTCGGINLNEVNFKTMESRKQTELFFAGEVLDIDALTGGFNFQNAWTTGWIAGNAMGE